MNFCSKSSLKLQGKIISLLFALLTKLQTSSFGHISAPRQEFLTIKRAKVIVNVHPHTICHMSHVTCHMLYARCNVSGVRCQESSVKKFLFIFYKIVELVRGGSVINRANPVDFQSIGPLGRCFL